jgi:hypothetical protein
LQSLLRSKEIPMKRLFKNLFGVEKSNTRVHKKSLRLGLEALEDRQLLSVSAQFNGNLLSIDCPDKFAKVVVRDRFISNPGTSDHGLLEVVTIDQNGSDQKVPISSNGESYPYIPSFSLGTYRIEAKLSGNTQSFRYQLADGFNFSSPEAKAHEIDVTDTGGWYEYHGGRFEPWDHTNQVAFNFQDTNGRSQDIRQDLTINVSGQGGDNVSVNVGIIDKCHVTINDTGGKQNTFSLAERGWISDSTLDVTARRGEGLVQGSVNLVGSTYHSHVNVTADLSNPTPLPPRTQNNFDFKQSGDLYSSNLYVGVMGSPGQDSVSSEFGHLVKSEAKIDANFSQGTGAEYFHNVLKGNVEYNSYVGVYAEGGSGYNGFYAETDPHAGAIGVDATSGVAYDLRTGRGVGVNSVSTYFDLLGTLTVKTLGDLDSGSSSGSGLDFNEVYIKTTPYSTGTLDVYLYGGTEWNWQTLDLDVGSSVKIREAAVVAGSGFSSCWVHGNGIQVLNYSPENVTWF